MCVEDRTLGLGMVRPNGHGFGCSDVVRGCISSGDNFRTKSAVVRHPSVSLDIWWSGGAFCRLFSPPKMNVDQQVQEGMFWIPG